MPALTRSALEFPTFTQEEAARVATIASRLRARGEVTNPMFDSVYPDAVRRASLMHWTSIEVCARLVDLLALGPSDRVLDIGAGVGKFCIAIAAMSGARVRGIEALPDLVAVAREAARRLAIDVEITSGELDSGSCELADVTYLFNPFTVDIPIPGAPERTARQKARDIAATERLLTTAAVGARIVTFCGFGGTMPSRYRRLVNEEWDGGALEIWQKE